MIIVRSFPPNIEKIAKAFELRPGFVFTYGDTIYAPGIPADFQINRPLLKHEQTHEKQQGGDPEAWWDRYIADPKFRADQELEAYRVQWKTAKKLIRLGRDRQGYVEKLATDFSSPVYGNCISFERALRLIKHENLF